MTTSAKVAVIGAGAAGLVAVREAVREGHRVTCYEVCSGRGSVPSTPVIWWAGRCLNLAGLVCTYHYPILEPSAMRCICPSRPSQSLKQPHSALQPSGSPDPGARVRQAANGVGGLWAYSDDTEADPLGTDPHRRRVHSSMCVHMQRTSRSSPAPAAPTWKWCRPLREARHCCRSAGIGASERTSHGRSWASRTSLACRRRCEADRGTRGGILAMKRCAAPAASGTEAHLRNSFTRGSSAGGYATHGHIQGFMLCIAQGVQTAC
jgi:hypothetical protein